MQYHQGALSASDISPVAAVPLAPLTTLELGGPAAHFVRANTEEQLVSAVEWADIRGLPLLILGGGSNMVVADEGFAGLAVQVCTQGLAHDVHQGWVEVTVAAGQSWDRFVAHVSAQGWGGVECLSGIPGSVGATPIQNVGAYGQEVAETISRIRVLDRKQLRTRWLQAHELQFGYRDSLLRRHPDMFVVLEVVFRLQPGAAPAIRYAELQRALAAEASPSLITVRQHVLALRRKKSMVIDAADPNRRSAGSFFTNPIVDSAIAERVVSTAVERGLVNAQAEVPRWPLEGHQVKLAAGWLIEKSGFQKGHRQGPVGISSAHALALVHHGGGSTHALVALAQHIQAKVNEQFGVVLRAEPIFVGTAL